MNHYFPRIACCSALVVGVILAGGGPATAQNNSLFAAEQQRAAMTPADASPAQITHSDNSRTHTTAADASAAFMTLADTSWTFQAPAEAKVAQLHDIVKVTVAVKSTVASQGSIDRKKLGHGDLKLTSWIKFYGGNLGEDNAAYGTPEIRGDIDNQLQAQGNLQTQDKMTFTISCFIVDKRPNGNCVLEGTWSVHDNEENWEYALSGEIRPQDIKPDNSVISDNIADLKIIRKEAGHVRDSYRRGWALEWLDKWQPF